MLFTDQELQTPLNGATVLEAWVAVQLLDKALKFGIITAQELDTITKFRITLVASIEASVNKNIDVELVKAAQTPSTTDGNI